MTNDTIMINNSIHSKTHHDRDMARDSDDWCDSNIVGPDASASLILPVTPSRWTITDTAATARISVLTTSYEDDEDCPKPMGAHGTFLFFSVFSLFLITKYTRM